jgi:hypothetical protein
LFSLINQYFPALKQISVDDMIIDYIDCLNFLAQIPALRIIYQALIAKTLPQESTLNPQTLAAINFFNQQCPTINTAIIHPSRASLAYQITPSLCMHNLSFYFKIAHLNLAHFFPEILMKNMILDLDKKLEPYLITAKYLLSVLPIELMQLFLLNSFPKDLQNLLQEQPLASQIYAELIRFIDYIREDFQINSNHSFYRQVLSLFVKQLNINTLSTFDVAFAKIMQALNINHKLSKLLQEHTWTLKKTQAWQSFLPAYKQCFTNVPRIELKHKTNQIAEHAKDLDLKAIAQDCANVQEFSMQVFKNVFQN